MPITQIPRSARAAEELVDGIAAQVGSQIVLVSDVLEMTAPMEEQINQAGGTAADMSRLRAEGTRAHDRVASHRADRAAGPSSTPPKTPRSTAPSRRLAVRKRPHSPKQLEGERRLAAGISYPEYRAQLKREIERSKVDGHDGLVEGGDRPSPRSKPSTRERFSEQPEGGEQIHLRQLLITVRRRHGTHPGRKRVPAAEIARARIVAGEPFQEVAREDNAIEAASRRRSLAGCTASSLAAWMTSMADDPSAGRTLRRS